MQTITVKYYIILLCKATIYMKPQNITYDANVVYIFVKFTQKYGYMWSH